MSQLIKTDALYDWFGCKQPAKLMRVMRERNVRFHLDAIGHPITTLDAINDSLKDASTSDDVDF